MEGFKERITSATVDTQIDGGHGDLESAPANGIAVERSVDFAYH
jgi:hypothetical protein